MQSGLRLWLLAFLGFFLLHAGWAFAAPYDGQPDEQQHAVKAAATLHGELLPSGTGELHAPLSLYTPFCFEMHVEQAADCSKGPGGDPTLVPNASGARYYNPVYYFVLGWPLGIWPNWTGVLLARLLTGAAMAGLLASAVVAACRWTRHRAVLAGLVVAITPMLTSLGGAINPNGLEIAAGVALFAGLIPLVLEPGERINRAAVALVGVSASVLVTPRWLGIAGLGVILGAVLIGTSRAHLRALVRDRSVRAWSAVVAVAVVAAGAWMVVARPLPGGDADLGTSFEGVLKGEVLGMWPGIANQMVGVTGWSEVLQPGLIYVVWFMAVGLLVLGGLAVGGRGDRGRIVILFVGTFVPLIVEEMLIYNQVGWFNQGRYFLPGAVGLPMLGAHVLAKRGLLPVHFRSMTRTLAVLLLPIHVVVLAYTMCRWQSGLKSLNPLYGSWLPPLGPVVPLAAGLLGVLGLLVMYWRASRLPADEASRGVDDEETRGLDQQPAAFRAPASEPALASRAK